MIERLQGKNVGVHKKLDLTFSPRVNSIIGRNFAGKSTIIRIIKWVSRNRPAGDGIINWDSKQARARITTSNGDKITRTKGKGVNLYKLNNEKYKAFGSDVPNDIKKALGLSDINFQGQHDPPFLFCKTAGEVSRQLNSIVNLDAMDKTLSNIGSALRKSQTTVEITKDRLDEASSQLEELEYINQMDEDLQAVEYLYEQYTTKTVELDALRETLTGVQLHQGELNIARDKVSDTKDLLVKGRIYSKIAKKRENLLESINRVRISKEERCQAQAELKASKKELEGVAGTRCPLCGKKR